MTHTCEGNGADGAHAQLLPVQKPGCGGARHHSLEPQIALHSHDSPNWPTSQFMSHISHQGLSVFQEHVHGVVSSAAAFFHPVHLKFCSHIRADVPFVVTWRSTPV